MSNKLEKSTGTYVIESQEQGFAVYSMIEVDRIDNDYYWRNVDDALARPMAEDLWGVIENLDDVGQEDEIQPGFYFAMFSGTHPRAVEIVKFKSQYYYRDIGGHLLIKLTLDDNKLPDNFKRVETDTLDVRAIIVDDAMLNRILNSK